MQVPVLQGRNQAGKSISASIAIVDPEPWPLQKTHQTDEKLAISWLSLLGVL
jgi:hypothetical protein